MISRMGARFGLVLLLCLFSSAAQARECVVLMPGIAMPWLTMRVLENRLEADGFAVWNKPIKTTDRSIAAIALEIDRGAAECRTQAATPIHFVTHSMGALMVRSYFQDREKGDFGRVVMLGPPNRGSKVADRLVRFWWYRWFWGPAGQEMGTDPGSTANRLRPISLEVGVIAALRDNKVPLENTRLDEMTDHVIVDVNHTGLPYSREVYAHVRSFLRSGHFQWVSERAPTAVAAENRDGVVTQRAQGGKPSAE
jgi:hypothetical protein